MSLEPTLTLAFVWPTWLIGILVVLFMVFCILMVLTVLIQKPQGGGLASAFGGGASAGQTAFGTKTGDALTIFTISVFVLYLLTAVVLNWSARPQAAPAEPALTGQGVPVQIPAGGDSPIVLPADPAGGAATPAEVVPQPPAAPEGDGATPAEIAPPATDPPAQSPGRA
ncbi:MAG: preprotein translocase subunit SecG [Phycisphaeraceae bacterium]|nr:preprotein translocase subunit SecG [Phycisphaeraceae bacterium]